jgi:hypothetical protein
MSGAVHEGVPGATSFLSRFIVRSAKYRPTLEIGDAMLVNLGALVSVDGLAIQGKLGLSTRPASP